MDLLCVLVILGGQYWTDKIGKMWVAESDHCVCECENYAVCTWVRG